jgi:zinc protease
MRLKNIVLALGACLCISANLSAQEDFRKNPPKPGPAPSIEIGESEVFTLDNGLTVVLVENHKLPRVSFQLSVDVPDFSEGEKAGYVSIAGDLMGRGTSSITKSEIDESIDFIGANFQTYGSGMFGSCLSKNTDELLTIMSDVLLNPVFPASEFEKIKKTTLSNIAQTQNSPDAIMGNVRRRVVYGENHPFGSIETEETINSIEVADCKAYYDQFFKPNISYLVIVGDMNVKTAKTVAEKYFGSWESGQIPVFKPVAVDRPEGVNVVFVDQPGAVQSTVAVCYPLDYSLTSSDYITGSLMSTVLGGYFGSRLNQNLREDKAFTYGARGGLRPNKLIGNFAASASVRNEVSDSSVTEMLFEMNRMIDEALTEQELSTVKNFRTGNFAIGLENPRTIADFALNIIRYDLEDDFYSNYLKVLNAISVEDMGAVAKKYLKPDNCYVIVVGNKSEVAESLIQFDSNGSIDYYDAYGKRLEETKVPVSVNAETVISDYLNVIGGEDKLKEVDVIEMNYFASTNFGELEFYAAKSKSRNMVQKISMGGMTYMKMVVNGIDGYVEARGSTQDMSPMEIASRKMNASPFGELSYFDTSQFNSVKLAGIEKINDEDAYRIDLVRTDGVNITEYYSVASSLKLRQVYSAEEGVRTSDYDVYKDYEGIMLPTIVKVTGMMPDVIEQNLKTAEINPKNASDLFK